MVATKGGKNRPGSAWTTADPPRRAVTVAEAAELLAVPLRDVRRAASQVKPYRHADGSDRWPLRELARVLADAGRVVGPELGPFLPKVDRRQRYRERSRG
jgi:hypothetical protein